MTHQGPLATRDRCLCPCHPPEGALRLTPGGCLECGLIHPPGEMAVWEDAPPVTTIPDRHYALDPVATEAHRIVDAIEQLPTDRPR